MIPGHGAVFTDVDARPRPSRAQRLERLSCANPAKHTRHAAKVLLKFKLLELQSLPVADFVAWAQAAPYFRLMARQHFPDADFGAWIDELVAELVRAGAAVIDDGLIVNAG